jgi:Na+-transporting methylmalonyl-CoA/oxaloacetate decarboxylase gamma subunit
MLVKIYGMLWVFGIVVAALFFLTGNLTPVVAVVFGFITFGMVFMGMMGVLPSTVGHNAPAPVDKAETVQVKVKEEKVVPATAAVHAH